MQKHWKDIEFTTWKKGEISVSTNEYGEGPIILEIEGDGYETYDLDHWMTPAEARELANVLISAADAADAAMRSDD